MAQKKAKSKSKAKARAVRKTPKRRASKAAPKRKARQTPETLRLRATTLGFTVDDLGRSLAFYQGLLRFHVGERWEKDGVLHGVMLKAGSCELGLSQDDWQKGRDRSKGVGVRAWFEITQDVDAMAARVKAAGVPLTEEPKDGYGGRWFSVDDPDGYHLTFFLETGKKG
jgi:catechol 2,3-dioxygenase-like lactoylglutathione lyase family enzyme